MSHHALVVDDDPASRFIYQQILSSLGFQIIAVSDGATAREYLQSNTYDVVFLDLLLPLVNGFELLDLIREQPHLATTTVVVISAHLRLKETLHLRDHDCFLLKPATVQAVRNAVHHIAGSARNGK